MALPIANTVLVKKNKKHKKSTFSLEKLPDVCIHRLLVFFVHENGIDLESFQSFQAVSKLLSEIANSKEVWCHIPMVLSTGQINTHSLKMIKLKSQGTEGTCYQIYSRPQRRYLALKRARVFPDNEGVPYYMMRELSALKV